MKRNVFAFLVSFLVLLASFGAPLLVHADTEWDAISKCMATTVTKDVPFTGNCINVGEKCPGDTMPAGSYALSPWAYSMTKSCPICCMEPKMGTSFSPCVTELWGGQHATCRKTCGEFETPVTDPKATCTLGLVCCSVKSLIDRCTTEGETRDKLVPVPATPVAPAGNSTVKQICKGGAWQDVETTAAPSPRIVILPDPLGGADLPTLIGRLINTFLGMVGAFALLAFVYAGLMYLTSAGRQDAVKKSKETMKYAFFGLVIIVFAYAISTFFLTVLTI